MALCAEYIYVYTNIVCVESARFGELWFWCTKREREKEHDRSGFETPFSGGYSTSTNKEEHEFQMSDYSYSDWLYKVICFHP